MMKTYHRPVLNNNVDIMRPCTSRVLILFEIGLELISWDVSNLKIPSSCLYITANFEIAQIPLLMASMMKAFIRPAWLGQVKEHSSLFWTTKKPNSSIYTAGPSQ